MRTYAKKRFTVVKKSVRRVYRTKRTVIPKAIKSYVSKTIHRNLENKSYQIQWSQQLGGFANNNLLYAFPLTPYSGGLNISQGVTQSTRVGNKIRPRRLMWNMMFSPTAYNATTNSAPQPLEIEVYLCSMKKCPGELPLQTDIANFYQSNASSIAPTGSLIDFTQEVNSDMFNCHKRLRFKIGFASFNGTGLNVGIQSFNNNDFKINIHRKINIMKYCPKVVTYNDSAVSPTSRCVFALVNVSPCIGGTQFSAGQLPLRLDSTISLEYEDA